MLFNSSFCSVSAVAVWLVYVSTVLQMSISTSKAGLGCAEAESLITCALDAVLMMQMSITVVAAATRSAVQQWPC